jgi:glycosyltransferase involved in cell wall biosynthesis
LLTCTNENLSKLNSVLLRIQLYLLVGKIDTDTVVWSLYCSHKNIIKKYSKAYKIYWPGDLYDAPKETNLLRFYNLIMPLTEVNYDYIKLKYPNKAFLSTTGCDENIFSIALMKSKNYCPKEMRFEDNLKVLGYVGNISSLRLDFELIEDLVNECNKIRFILIGISDQTDETSKWINRLKTYKNFNLIENINYADIPLYIYRFDACFIPYKLNKFNLGTNPNKFFEYCSMGKITLSSKIPSLIKYKPFIFLNGTKEEWIKNIYHSLKSKVDKQKLVSIAMEASPAVSIKRISDFIQAHKK